MAPPVEFPEQGDRFAHLVVVRRLSNGRPGPVRWLCRCDCGEETVKRASHVRSGATKSCGCLKIKYRTAMRSVAAIWRSMIHRCESPKDSRYHQYGGRGIKVCPRWRESFETFAADMGPRPSPDHSIERENGNGDYEPTNCRWATIGEQARNRRNNTPLTWRGETLVIAGWAERLDLLPQTISGRLQRGWSIERALSTPATYRGLNNHSRNPRLAVGQTPLFRASGAA